MSEQWSDLGMQALEIADVVMTVSDQLERSAERLQALIAKAADTPTEHEEQKRNTLLIWRATLANIREAQWALHVGRE